MLRNDEVAPGDAPRVRRRAAQPRPRHAGEGRRLRRPGPRGRGRGAGARRLPRPPGDRGRLRRGRRARPGAAARQDQRGAARRAPACWPGCRRRSPRPATTRSRSREDTPAGRARGDRPDGERRGDGAAAPRRCRSRACSSTPSRCSPRAATGCSPTGWSTCGDPGARAAASARPRRHPRLTRLGSGQRRQDGVRGRGPDGRVRGADRLEADRPGRWVSRRRWGARRVGGQRRRGVRRCLGGLGRRGGDDERHRRTRAGRSRSAAGSVPEHGAGLGVGRLLLLRAVGDGEAGLLEPALRALASSVAGPRRAPCCCRWRSVMSTRLPAGTVSPSLGLTLITVLRVSSEAPGRCHPARGRRR